MLLPVIPEKSTFLNNASPSDAKSSSFDISRWQISWRVAVTSYRATGDFETLHYDAVGEKNPTIASHNCGHDSVETAVFHATSCAGEPRLRLRIDSTLRIHALSLPLSLFLSAHASRWLTRGGRWRAALERKYLAVASSAAHYRATACLR